MDMHFITQWWPQLASQLQLDYWQQLESFIEQEEQAGKQVYPSAVNRFAAFTSTPLQQVKVVVLGQDPYHGPNQAHGLSFSVPEYEKIPPSLINIFKEIERDYGYQFPMHGCLTQWAQQGVLLLNTVLTVERGKAGSHQGKGWEQFTDAAISAVNEHRENVVFMLWGKHAQAKADLIDDTRHLVLTAPHPSPLSAHRGFIGCGHFRGANEYLAAHQQVEINWHVD